MRSLAAWAPALAIMVGIWILSGISGLAIAEGTSDTITRKTAHLVAFGALAVAFGYALRRQGGAAIQGAFALTVAYAAIDELHQSTVAGRNGTPVDVVIDAVGAAVGLGLARWAPRLRAGAGR